MDVVSPFGNDATVPCSHEWKLEGCTCGLFLLICSPYHMYGIRSATSTKAQKAPFRGKILRGDILLLIGIVVAIYWPCLSVGLLFLNGQRQGLGPLEVVSLCPPTTRIGKEQHLKWLG